MFYKRLEEICTRKKRTVRDVLKAAKVPATTAIYWKQGGNPSAKWIGRLAEELKVNAGSLLA